MTSDDAAACPVPAIDWRFVSREEIARLAQQGLVATAADSADRCSIRDDSNLRRRRLRRVAREASAELARVVAEWRNEDFRRRDPQAVAVLAAERHQRSLSCSDLGGIRCGAEDEREDGLSWAKIARLAQQGLVATAADSADHRTIRDDIESLRRRRRLRHVAREASAELARVVAEWRNEDFRRCDPQAVAVLAAERHQRSLSCSNLGGIHRGTEDEREYGLSWASDGCENGLETTAVADERAQGTRASSRVEVPSKDSQSGSPSCASWGSNTSRHQQGVGSSVLLPELCPFPPMDWRHVAPAGSPLPSSHISNHDRDNASHSVPLSPNKLTSSLKRI
ncbi:unnamed protein product [Closterium sp. NIES-53]